MPSPTPRSPTRRARHPLALLLLLALWLTTVGNLPFWAAVWNLPQSQDWIALLTGLNLGLLLLALNVAVLSLLIWPRWRRSGGVALLVTATAASYFMNAYGVVIDASMLRNALATHAREVRDLLSGGMLAALLLGVLLPGWWWWRQPVRPVPARRLMAQQLGVSFVALLVVFFLGWASFQDLASLVRNHKALRYMVNPYNSAYALVRNVAGSASKIQQPVRAIGEDAVLARLAAADPAQSPLIVLVVGETARAANFGLGGYPRDTTPRLRELQAQGQLVYFSQVSSCGTNTEDSVPCMFSHLGREEFVASRARHENLLDVLQRAGMAVLWLDNQSGCKGVCDRVPNADTSSLNVTDLCPDGECLDEVMLRELPARLAALDPARRARGTVVVLHQMGSHGPAYHKRAPQAVKAFQPECTHAALQSCAREHLVNAYDNSIRYTDHFLTDLTLWLQAQRRPTALLYVSDHGESLSEKGLYLHGMPYAMAPREQTHVPMLLWMSAPMAQGLGLDLGCLKSNSARPISHDHLFHTMLSLAQVSTRARDPQRDVLEDCQPHLTPQG
jgi:lipid A ethanolaminephosphotransferase